MPKTLLLCDCDNTQTLDREGIEKASGLKCSRVYNGLCVNGLDIAAKAFADGDVIVACGQQGELFSDLAAELELPMPQSVDIRDRAGWSDEGKKATPKIAALLADAQLAPPAGKMLDVISEGLCLILGSAETALAAANKLSGTLSVTVVVPSADEVALQDVGNADILIGKIRNAQGALGNFNVTVDGLRTADPSGRGTLHFTPAKDGGKSSCDIILDLSGDAPLFPAHEKREGYFRADPRDPLSVADAVFETAQMLGTFEKPLYVKFDDQLCAHSRASQSGCDRCINVCPTGAISPAGDFVNIDPNICAGCGSCAAVCPSGAVSFDDPPATFIFQRMRTLATAYLDAGGKAPRLLVHDADHGRQMIELAARFGRGLPANAIPMEISNISGFGHTETLVALTSGFVSVDILVGPKTERDALDPELDLSRALLSGINVEAPVHILDLNDPDKLSEALYDRQDVKAHDFSAILPLGARRDATRLAMKSLAGGADISDPLPLPAGAPYGAVIVDTNACTLCLSCASLCPTGALGDNPDNPQLTFKEDACLQCGICASTCPETAITLKPQFDISDNALAQNVLHEEEPFECIECSKPFGVRSTIERIVEKLEGNHSMFINSDNTRLIRMCDDCRVNAQFRNDQPMASVDRPQVRTTDDYLKARKPN